jgi:cellulose biosynthesis protein BcsQ
MKVLAVGAQKGGVGKTTSSLYLAARAAEVLGGDAHRPVVGLLDRDETKGLSELLALRPELLPTGVLLLEGEALPVRPSDLQLVIIDTPPGYTAISSLREADLIVVPVLPEDIGIANLIKYLQGIENNRVLISPQMRLVALLPTLVDLRTSLHRRRLAEVLQIAAEHRPPLAVLTAVPRRTRIAAYDLRATDYDTPAQELFAHAGIVASATAAS